MKTRKIYNSLMNILIILILFFTTQSYLLFSNFIYSTTFVINYFDNTEIIKNGFGFHPYTLEINKFNGGLFYYGSFHNVNLKHPQFVDIEKKWNKFKPDLAYCEGHNWPLIKVRNSAIRKCGEQGLLRYLAYRDKVKIKSIEPSKRMELRYILKHYPAAKVKIYYVLRQLIINKEIFRKNINSNSYIRGLLRNISKCIYFNNLIMTIAEFNWNIKRLLPDLKDWRKIDSKYFMNIRRPNNWLAKINVLVNKYRDKYMVKKILEELRKGKKIFALVGKSHVVNQEDILLKKINIL